MTGVCKILDANNHEVFSCRAGDMTLSMERMMERQAQRIGGTFVYILS